jgi:hypothetical protein
LTAFCGTRGLRCDPFSNTRIDCQSYSTVFARFCIVPKLCRNLLNGEVDRRTDRRFVWIEFQQSAQLPLNAGQVAFGARLLDRIADLPCQRGIGWNGKLALTNRRLERACCQSHKQNCN